MRPWYIGALLVVLTASLLSAAPAIIPADQPARQSGHKRMVALKVTGPAPKIDGKLDDVAWKSALFMSDFLQKDPVEGAAPSDRTEVAVLYDNNGVYVGARLHCQDPSKLRMHLDRRDNQGPAEQFIVSIDSYHDRRTAVGFGVNTAGVRFDRYNPEDDEFIRDYSYDRVWQAHTSRDSSGWIAEMFIPFSQLRFNEQPTQIWGINFNRWIPEKNEDVYWVYVPKNQTGWSSYFGELVGIEGVKPSRRIEFLPYAASDASILDGNFANNPFTSGKELKGHAGADLKMGVGPSLTLDATFNPDFGQVELDPAEVNLSAFETIFDERRPFFTESSDLLNGPEAGGYFYSRRIGGAPKGSVSAEYVDQPRNTSILGAAKLAGRLNSGTAVGFLTALTQRENARVHDPELDSTWETPVEPTTFYSVGRIQRQFGSNQSTIGAMLTAVERDLEPGSRLDSLLRRRAYTGGADWRLRFGGGSYEWFGMAGMSYIGGSKAAMLRTQRSSTHYYQRPDIDWISLDPNRTSLTGYRGAMQLRKISGKHWLWSLWAGTKSPALELNDIGAQGTADDINFNGELIYRQTAPSKLFRSYSLEFFANQNLNYGWVRQYGDIGSRIDVTWHNYWQSWFSVNHQITGQDDAKTRGGPSMRNEAGISLNAGLSNNFAATTRYGGRAWLGLDELDGWLWGVGTDFSARIGTRVQLSVNPYYQAEDQPRQYVTTVAGAGGGEATYGRRYVFSRLSRNTLSMRVRMNYYFSPNLSLELYAEPYASAGRYYDHGELMAAKGHDIRKYETITRQFDEASGAHYYAVIDGSAEFTVPDRDFGARSFRSNMVLRWEFRPGSTLYMVWQRNLGEDREAGRLIRPGSLFDSFGASGEDFFALKVSYWIPLS